MKTRSKTPGDGGLQRWHDAVKRGSIDANKAQQLLKETDRGGLQHDEARIVRQLYYAHPDAFDGTARGVMEKFIASFDTAVRTAPVATVPRGPIQDPQLLRFANLDYQGVKGQLFVDGVSADDPVQGRVGDCYLMASLSAIAQMRPDIIEKAVRDNGDGTYGVTFYRPGFDGKRTPYEVVVDGDLPVREGGLVAGHSSDQHELWPAIIEKAWASQQFSGYEGINFGGTADRMIAALTGMPTNSFEVAEVAREMKPEKLFAEIKDGLEKKSIAVASTYQRQMDDPEFAASGLIGGHAYAMLSAFERDGKKFIELRNPWGSVEPEGDGKDDGRFVLPYEQFLKYFKYIDSA